MTEIYLPELFLLSVLFPWKRGSMKAFIMYTTDIPNTDDRNARKNAITR